jgi:hypothetical protein
MGMASNPVADTCSRCGGSRIVRILWGYSTLTDTDSEAVESGQDILGLNWRYFRKYDPVTLPGATVHLLEESFLPKWACLDCNPEWNNLNRLASRELDHEKAMDAACKAEEFEKAAWLRHLWKGTEHEHAQEIWNILSVLVADAVIGEIVEPPGPAAP